MDKQLLYDVAIIGGGLAGLSLAIQCAEQGFGVALLEKEEYPFHKVCGEYISLESWSFLKRLGVNLDEMKLPVIKNLLLSDTSGKSYEFNLPLGGFGISRFTLDYKLSKIAAAVNVHLLTNCKVNDVTLAKDIFFLATSAGELQAKVVVGSFGKRSNLDIKWNRPFTSKKNKALNNYIGIKYHVQLPHPPDFIQLHNFKDGYCGLSKIEEDKSCLCYLTTAENLRNSGNSVKQLEREILFRNRFLKEIFTDAKFLYHEPLAISQISFSKKTQVENHVLMLGDAAGMITPLCGNGMSMAMHSSKIAFEYISKFLLNNIMREDMEMSFTRAWRKQFSQRLFVGRTVQSFFGGDQTTSLFLKIMNAFPVISETLIRSTHGKPF